MNFVGCLVLLPKYNVKDIVLFLIDSILTEPEEKFPTQRLYLSTFIRNIMGQLSSKTPSILMI